jgi:hypothetical protein
MPLPLTFAPSDGGIAPLSAILAFIAAYDRTRQLALTKINKAWDSAARSMRAMLVLGLPVQGA